MSRTTRRAIAGVDRPRDVIHCSRCNGVMVEIGRNEKLIDRGKAYLLETYYNCYKCGNVSTKRKEVGAKVFDEENVIIMG